MSRNKVILLISAVVILYLMLPNYGIRGTIKANMVALAPYVLLFIIIYLVITINVLKRAMQKLSADISDQHAISVAKIMRITFDVKRIMGPANLVELYKRVNYSRQVSLHAKELLYHAMKRKKLDIPPPSDGKNGQPDIQRTHDNIKETRIGSNKRNRHAQNKKKK